MGRVYRREGSKNYYIAYYDEVGELIRLSAGTTVEAVAEEKLAVIEARILASKASDPAAAARADEGAAADIDPLSIETRLRRLESAIRQLYLHQRFHAGMLRLWSETSEKFVPDEWKSSENRFFDDPIEGRNGD